MAKFECDLTQTRPLDEETLTAKKDELVSRDLEYGINGAETVTTTSKTIYDKSDTNDEDTLVSKQEIKEKMDFIRDEVKDAEKDMGTDIDGAGFLSNKQKKTLKSVFSKKLESIRKKHEKSIEDMSSYASDLNDIDEELDEDISKLKDLVTEMLDDDDYYDDGYSQYKQYAAYGEKDWKKNWGYQSKIDDDDRWPKRTCVSSTYKKPEEKDYSKDMKEISSDKRLTIKVDKTSLEKFLCESDGKNENMAVITSDNREYSDIEKLVFKIALIPEEHKTRRTAFTEADGKKIAEAMDSIGVTKCGWIHTHPFGEHSTFFSGTDVTNTKEMCVLPDDYSIAIVVGCVYNEAKNYMTEDCRVVKEYQLRYSLGRMIYRKLEIPTYEYDKKSDKLKQKPELSLVKYDCDIQIVDEHGNPVQEVYTVPPEAAKNILENEKNREDKNSTTKYMSDQQKAIYEDSCCQMVD